MNNDWQIDEDAKTITNKNSGLKFKWHITPSGLALAPFSPVTNDDSYVSQLKEAKNVLQQHFES
jgi:hypothetical protein